MKSQRIDVEVGIFLEEKNNWLDLFEKQYRLKLFGKTIQEPCENIIYFSKCIDQRVVLEIDQDKKRISVKKDNYFKNDHRDEIVKYLLQNSSRWEEMGLKNIDMTLRIIGIESNQYFTIYSFDTPAIH